MIPTDMPAAASCALARVHEHDQRAGRRAVAPGAASRAGGGQRRCEASSSSRPSAARRRPWLSPPSPSAAPLAGPDGDRLDRGRVAAAVGAGRRRLVQRALDVHVRQQAVEPGGDPPGHIAEQVQRGGQQQAADHERVEEHGAREAQPELLDHAVFAEHEREEHADHDRGGGGHHASGERQALADRAAAVAVIVQRSWMRETRNTS